jgi:hypothetical protein
VIQQHGPLIGHRKFALVDDERVPVFEHGDFANGKSSGAGDCGRGGRLTRDAAPA